MSARLPAPSHLPTRVSSLLRTRRRRALRRHPTRTAMPPPPPPTPTRASLHVRFRSHIAQWALRLPSWPVLLLPTSGLARQAQVPNSTPTTLSRRPSIRQTHPELWAPRPVGPSASMSTTSRIVSWALESIYATRRMRLQSTTLAPLVKMLGLVCLRTRPATGLPYMAQASPTSLASRQASRRRSSNSPKQSALGTSQPTVCPPRAQWSTTTPS